MRTSETITLPVAGPEYGLSDEQVMRRTVEQALRSLRSDIISNRDGSFSTASLAQKRHQFLLMGG